MEMDFFHQRMRESGITSVMPEKQAARDFIQHALKEELGRGIIKEQTRRAYVEIIGELIESGAEGIILGCTEIPLIISQQMCRFRFLIPQKFTRTLVLIFCCLNE
jgi:aspartate racemase